MKPQTCICRKISKIWVIPAPHVQLPPHFVGIFKPLHPLAKLPSRRPWLYTYFSYLTNSGGNPLVLISYFLHVGYINTVEQWEIISGLPRCPCYETRLANGTTASQLSFRDRLFSIKWWLFLVVFTDIFLLNRMLGSLHKVCRVPTILLCTRITQVLDGETLRTFLRILSK